MTATADMIIDRRRTRRRLAFWRIAAIVAIVVAVIAMLPRFIAPGGGPHIARIDVTGIIFHDPLRERAILDLAENDSVEAVIIAIDSPGGTLVGSEALYEAIRKVADAKPVVATMSEFAASGGYITALAADHIVARQNTLTGSIGVVLEAPNFEDLLTTLGIEVNRIKSAPLKAEPTYTSKPTPEALAVQQELIDDAFDWFRGLVRDRRGLEGPALAKVTDGRAHTGRQALALGLVDALGDEAVARTWLEQEHSISPDLVVQNHTWGDDEVPWPLGDIGGLEGIFTQSQHVFTSIPRLYALVR
ncbi:MAG: signal peptide peptidase SppA [Pseudomonadota bacterium]